MAEITINIHDQPCGNCTICIGRNIGANHEQERIIKLLDNWKCGHPECDGDKTEVCYPKHYLIELIKRDK